MVQEQKLRPSVPNDTKYIVEATETGIKKPWNRTTKEEKAVFCISPFPLRDCHAT